MQIRDLSEDCGAGAPAGMNVLAVSVEQLYCPETRGFWVNRTMISLVDGIFKKPAGTLTLVF
jgi:hypothetical protein